MKDTNLTKLSPYWG